MQPSIEYIVEHFQTGLQRLCLGYVYDPEEAKDLVQEVLVKVWTYLPEFRGEASIKTWVYRVCSKHLLDAPA